MPEAHPFNPLPLLRLTLARDGDRAVVERLFQFVWRDGHTPLNTAAWTKLMDELGATREEMKDPAVKQRLLANGEEAIAKGIFGVPTIEVNGEVFWGVDGFEFLQDYLADPALLNEPSMRTADVVPSGV